MECEAVKQVRDDMGLHNVKLMIPFCRTIAEGNKVIAEMKRYGLEQGINNLEIYVMAEIPSNVILAKNLPRSLMVFPLGQMTLRN